ncbi:hypothetical protein IWX76_002880 [Pedobacter sp. CAN_A7]|uniref:AAA family ATPase n=1 Tax=Pedobacter sp. CAN_A7 TaxID=2787722 RepID=UPI0018C8EA3C
MMKLKTIEVDKFRGATRPLKLEFNPSKPISMIFGENGNGKSSIADAFIVLCTDNLGSIRDKSSIDKEFIRSLGSDAKDLKIKLATDSGIFNTALNASGTGFIKTPSAGFPVVRHLRRSHIIHLIDAEPAKRYEVLKDYIDVGEIMKCEEELRKAKKSAVLAFSQLKAVINSATETLIKSWQLENSPMGSWEIWAKAESSKDISKLLERQGKIKQVLQDWITLLSKRDDVKKTNAKYGANIKIERAAVEKIQGLNRDNPLNDFSILKVLSEANSYISGKAETELCPVCDQGINKQQLLSSLKEKISKMNIFQAAQKVQEEAKKLKDQTESTLKTQVSSFIENLEVFIPALKKMLAPDDPLISNVEQFEKSSGNNEKYKLFNACNVAVQMFVGDLQAESENIEKSKNQHNLIKQQFEALVKSTKQQGKAEQLALMTASALSIVETSRKEFIDQELNSISGDVELLYQKMHPDENLGGIRIFLKPNAKNSLELNADFHSQSSITPQSVYSESHLDTLGICIFLALARKYNEEDTILILDDVVMSVDETHLDRFIEILHEQVSAFAHILITTHYRPWKDRYRFSRAPSHQVHFIELRNWSIENGIRTQNGKIDLEELRKALDSPEFDRQRISSLAGTVLENVLDFISVKYACKVPRKSKSEYVLRELLDCISSKLQKVLKVQHFKKDELGAYDYSAFVKEQELKPLLDALKQLSAVRNQVGAHYNFDGSLVSDRDVEAFGELVYEFTHNLVCPEKGNFPDRNKSGSYLETIEGSIRLFPLTEPST